MTRRIARLVVVLAALVAVVAWAERPKNETQLLLQAFGSTATPSTAAVSTLSASIASLVPGGMYEVVCSISVFYRITAGASTAVTTDLLLPVNTVKTILFKDSPAEDTMSFITAAGTGTCFVARKQ